ncbi:SPW repeat protein [Microvirga terricola]|uniref:SPW repeat protein n=1 Tax=Microvirga terricola TaxID=2719797 RepID=A0ABX0VB59_9HYPH|nr:SPW repeat protein [Microvirga terricola]NIX75042.1 SPW repeat protein [Microvirga terricola]
MQISARSIDIAFGIAGAILGGILFLSPWFLGFNSVPIAAWNAWFCGGLIALISLSSLSQAYDWEEWIDLIVGLWTAASPWLLGFFGTISAMWVHLIVGLGIVVLSALELQRIYAAS